MEEKLNLIGIKTPEGIYLSNYDQQSNWNYYLNVGDYKINEQSPKKTFDSHWCLVDKEPASVYKTQNPRLENYRYVLKDERLASEIVPAMLNRDDATYLDGDGYRNWKAEYAHLMSLYELVWDEVPQPDKEIEFEYTRILEVEGLKEFPELGYEFYRTEWASEGTTNLQSGHLKFQRIDEIRFPKIYYQTHCPVCLPSKTFYDIIRYHVNSNIDRSVATVAGDYNFCFYVKKKIVRINPLVIKEEQLKTNGKRYRKPVFVTKTLQYAGDVVVFRMTNTKDRYQDYPVLPDLYADNIDELQKKLDSILGKLMNFINTPFTLCPCCNGKGYQADVDQIDINSLINGE